MATDIGGAYCDWSHDEFSDRNDSEATSLNQILDHGSISFGRFAVESLSWEKRSVFSHNRCQEELEKFKAPGLVAQKKAYFEEYYKRIRAMKALQQDQQTALALDSVGNTSACSQISEDRQNIESEIRNQIAHLEENCVELTMEKENSIVAPQVQYSETESTSSYPDSLQRSSKDDTREEIEQQNKDCNDFDDKEVLRKDECSIITVEPKAAAPESAVSTERTLEVKQSYNLVPDRVQSSLMNCKDRTTFPKAKVAASPVRNNRKLDGRVKEDTVKSSQTLEYSLRKETTKKAENSIESKKTTTSNRGSINNKSTFVSPHKPLTEVRSNVTVPRPFSLATERRVAVPTNIRDITYGHQTSKAPNRFMKSPAHAKGISCLQNTSKEITATGGVKNIAQESRRGREIRESTVMDSRRAMSKGRDADDRRLKTISRSTNLPALNKSNQTGVTDFGVRSNLRRQKQNERNEETNMAELRQSSKFAASPQRSFYKGGGEVRQSSKFAAPPQPSFYKGEVRQSSKFVASLQPSFYKGEVRESSKFVASPLPSFYKSRIPKSDNKKIITLRSMDLPLKERKLRQGAPAWR
eukprot:TRINITY_DN19547_c0_g1_i2.p1 TRINITY_DN19547_c0_g1~~TRINITY_DN19547_c0_g1_i2.p1  ORF type:complete len:583 (-),score=101.13 TRINITY_DN19547_c0_g1_i2:222-1970(-)